MFKKILLSLFLFAAPVSLLANNFNLAHPINAKLKSDKEFAKYSGIDLGITVYSMIQDTKGNIWIGTSNGVYEQKAGTKNFNKIANGLPEKIDISTIFQDNENNIWVAARQDNGGLYEQKSGENTFVIITNGLPNPDTIHSIMQDNENNIWVAYAAYGDSLKSGIYEQKANTSTFLAVTNKLPINEVEFRSIFQDKNENIWIGTDAGLYEQKANSNKFSKITNGLPTDPKISTIYQDLDKNIWIGAGSSLYEQKNGFDEFLQIKDKEDKPINFVVNTIYQDSYKNIWIGSAAGLYEKRVDTDFFVLATSGLSSNDNILLIYQDNGNNIWVGANDGLYVSSPGFGYSYTYGAKSTTYNDGTANWIISNEAITFWAREDDILKITINKIEYDQGSFCLDGTNYEAKNGQYNISINYTKESGKADINFAFQIKQSIAADFNFNSPTADKLDQYQGYLNGEEARKVSVLYAYDPSGVNQAILNMQLGNELIIDWDNTYFQKLDANFLPTGDQNKFKDHAKQDFKTDGLYLLTITDLVGNSLTYYIQIGGNDPLISKVAYVPITPINPAKPIIHTKLAGWEIGMIAASVVLLILIIGFIFYWYQLKLKKNKSH